MQRNSTIAQVPELAEEGEGVAREVDILDAPLLTDQEVEADESGLEPTQNVETAVSQEARNTDAESALGVGTNEAAAATADLSADAPAETSDELQVDAAQADVAPNDLAASSDPADIAASSDKASGEALSEMSSLETDANETDLAQTVTVTDTAVVEAAPLGSSAPYRYNINEMETSTKIETEQGWVTYEGEVRSPEAVQRYFLIVQSLIREPPTLFSQGELNLDEAGNFEIRAKYATHSEFYKTYIIATADEEAAKSFKAKGESSGLPSSFNVVRPVVEVLVD